MDEENRKEPRFVYVNKLTLELDRRVGRGELVNLALHGMQFKTTVELDEVGGYRARFYLQQDQGLKRSKTILTKEGIIRWMFPQDEFHYLGIEFDEALDEDIDHLMDFMNEGGVYCYLYIFHPDNE